MKLLTEAQFKDMQRPARQRVRGGDGRRGDPAHPRAGERREAAREAADRRSTRPPGSGARRRRSGSRSSSRCASPATSPSWMVFTRAARDAAGAAPDGAARWRPFRDERPERPVPPRDQPQQPPQAAAGAGRAGDHHPQREADAAGGRRLADRQRPPRPRRRGLGEPQAEEPERHAQGQAGAVPPEPARQARRLLGPFGDRRRSGAEAAPVRAARSGWRWSCSSRSSCTRS